MGGYESMLKKMTPGNFNWFLHSMLFYHTKHVIKKQEEKTSRVNNSDSDSDYIRYYESRLITTNLTDYQTD